MSPSTLCYDHDTLCYAATEHICSPLNILLLSSSSIKSTNITVFSLLSQVGVYLFSASLRTAESCLYSTHYAVKNPINQSISGHNTTKNVQNNVEINTLLMNINNVRCVPESWPIAPGKGGRHSTEGSNRQAVMTVTQRSWGPAEFHSAKWIEPQVSQASVSAAGLLRSCEELRLGQCGGLLGRQSVWRKNNTSQNIYIKSGP